MKYIVLKTNINGKIVREVPIIFPKDLIHSDVAEHMMHMIIVSNKHTPIHVEVVSAGFIHVDEVVCSGKSETLDIKSRKEVDDKLISEYDFQHGFVHANG